MTDATKFLVFLAAAGLAAAIVIHRHRCALIFGGALIVAASLFAVAPLALAFLGAWIVAFSERGRGDDPTPLGRGGRPYRGEEP